MIVDDVGDELRSTAFVELELVVRKSDRELLDRSQEIVVPGIGWPGWWSAARHRDRLLVQEGENAKCDLGAVGAPGLAGCRQGDRRDFDSGIREQIHQCPDIGDRGAVVDDHDLVGIRLTRGTSHAQQQ